MSLLLNDEKQLHLAHIILRFLQKSRDVQLTGDSARVLREIKGVITDQVKLDQGIAQTVKVKLQSYSRRIPEGSAEWNVLYEKTYAEELRKRHLA